MVNTCVRQNNEKLEAKLYPMSGDTRNQIVVSCYRYLRAMHMTLGEAKKVSTIYRGNQIMYSQSDYHLNTEVITTVTNQYPSSGNLTKT